MKREPRSAEGSPLPLPLAQPHHHSPDFLASCTAWCKSSFLRSPYWSFHSSRFFFMLFRVSCTRAAVSLAFAAASLAFWIASFVPSLRGKERGFKHRQGQQEGPSHKLRIGG